MIKSFLIITCFQILLFASQQTILVVSEDFDSPKAKLECYENGKQLFKTIEVNIGKNGMGWGLGEIVLTQNSNDPIKKEGDKKAPAGIFKLTNAFGYEKERNLKLPYLFASKSLICVDDSKSEFYNQIIDKKKSTPNSFEWMRRDDHQYELGITVAHNKNAVEQRGSCIFLHVSKSKDAPTAGCTAMDLEDIKKIAEWLDKDKNPILIQIPKSSSKEILKLYPELKISKLLKEED